MKNIKPNASEKIHQSTWITLAILGSTILITMYGETMLLPAISDIISDFHISYSTSSWILTAYLISGAVMTPIAGKLSDIYGRKKMVLVIFIIYIIGIAIGGLSTNIYTLVLARIIQGIGISMFPIAFGIIRDQFPMSKIAIGIGIFSSMFAAGSVVGMAIGGTIVQNFGWQATFFTIIPVAIILWIIIKKRIKEDVTANINDGSEQNLDFSLPKKENTPSDQSNLSDKKPKHHIDIKGAISLALSISSFLLTLTYFANINSESNNFTSFDAIALGSLVTLTICSLIAFVIIERKANDPLIPLRLISDRILLPSNIILLVFGITMFMIYQTIPILVTSPIPFGFGGEAMDSAMVQLPFMIVFLIFAPSSGFIVSKIGNFKPIVVGSVLTTFGFASLFAFHANEFSISLNLIIISAGLSLTQVGAFNITLQHTPHQYSGVSIGISVVLVLMGSSIGPVIASTYMQAFQESVIGIGGQSFPSQLSYDLIFITATIISMISFPCMILLKRRTNQIISKRA
ncbi:MAG TPA: MFS transporter [Candidatus Nitrosocosmicus sp.]|nr:MFS transporter [Candidatus Nitrosocosmicus sp.]